MKMAKILWELCSVLSGVAAVALLFHIGHMYYLAQASESWPIVTGRIVSSNGYADLSTATKRHGPTGNCAVLKYRYEVASKPYVNDVSIIGDRHCVDFYTLGLYKIKAYSEDQPVDVHYDPDHPEVSTLIAGHMNDGRELIGVFGLVLVILMCRDGQRKAGNGLDKGKQNEGESGMD